MDFFQDKQGLFSKLMQNMDFDCKTGILKKKNRDFFQVGKWWDGK